MYTVFERKIGPNLNFYLSAKVKQKNQEYTPQTIQEAQDYTEDPYVQNEVFNYLSASIGLVVGLLFIGGFGVIALRVSRLKRQSKELRGPTHARILGKFFHERVRHFKDQIQTLDQHSNEYTSIFCSEDWENLRRTIAQLEESDTRIQGLLVKKQFDRAHELLAELYDPQKHPLDSIQADINSFKSGADWESQVRSMLKRVVTNLEAATSQVKQASEPQRSRKRKPTLVTLADVKKSLLEDEAISRELN